MPYAPSTIRLIMKGSLVGVQDWSSGLSVHVPNVFGLDYEDLLAYVQAVMPDFVTFFNSIATVRSLSCTFETMRGELYNGLDTAAYIAEVPTVGVTASTFNIQHAPSTAVAVGLLTNRPGASYKGRMYIPALAADVSSVSGAWIDAEQLTMRTALRTLILAINARLVSDNPSVVVVASRTLGSQAVVERVRTDQLIDVQRRRQNDFPRNYTSLEI